MREAKTESIAASLKRPVMSCIAIQGVGALGLTYHSCPYWKRLDGRPGIHLSLWWVKIIIWLPYRHVTPLGHGTATSNYGVFWWPKLSLKPKLHWNKLDT